MPRPYCRTSSGPDAHKQRIAEALQMEMYPHTALRPKVLAGALGVSEDTIRNWASGQNDPSSYMIGELFRYFGVMFWVRIYGQIGAEMKKRAEQRHQQGVAEHQAQAELLHMLSSPAVRGE